MLYLRAYKLLAKHKDSKKWLATKSNVGVRATERARKNGKKIPSIYLW